MSCLVYAGQLLFVYIYYPNAMFKGNTFLSQSGLDGAIDQYLFVLDLLPGHWTRTRYALHVGNWSFLYFAGAISCLVISLVYLVNRRIDFVRIVNFDLLILVLLISFGAYVPFAFVFSRGVVAHPDVYDYWIALPFIIALFGILPALLENIFSNTGLVVLIFSVIACALTFHQLRVFVVAFPL